MKTVEIQLRRVGTDEVHHLGTSDGSLDPGDRWLPILIHDWTYVEVLIKRTCDDPGYFWLGADADC